MQTMTKIKKRKQAKVNQELQALNALRANQDLYDAVQAWIANPHLNEVQREKLRAVLAVLSHAPLKKVLAYL